MHTIAALGGLFSILILCHFCSDWVFQSHAEAMSKAHNPRIRALHCAKYALPFWLLLRLGGASLVVSGLAMVILFVSHYVIDTYIPVMLWAKYLRKAPQFDAKKFVWTPGLWEDKKLELQPASRITDEDAFVSFASTPLGLVLAITMDQLFHIVCLVPVAWLWLGQ